MAIYIGLGANLDGPNGAPQTTFELALNQFSACRMEIVAQSRWYLSEAVPDPADPPFTNGVIEIKTNLAAISVLYELRGIERAFGRVRERRWAPRVLDLDLLDFNGISRAGGESDGLELPHPRLHFRAFVLLPLKEIAPNWSHPTMQKSIDQLIRNLPETAKAVAI